MMACTNDHSTMAVVLLAGVASLLFLWQRIKGKARRYHLPPGPPGLPIVGSLPFVHSNLHRYFADLSSSYGPILSLRLGSKLCVVISSTSAAREIFKDQDATFASHDVPAAVRFYLGTSPELLWNPYGPQWRILRKLAGKHVLNPASIEAVAPIRRREVGRAVAAVWEQAKISAAVDVREIIFKTVLDTTSSMLWGERVSDGDGVGPRFWQVAEKVIELMVKPNVADFYPAMARFDPQGLGKRVRSHMEWVYKFLDKIVEGKKKEMDDGDEDTSNKDVLRGLLKLMQRRDPQLETFTLHDLNNFLVNILGASIDTNTTTMEWALTELLIRPEIMRRVQQELDNTVGRERVVEESDIHKLGYLGVVLKETLRLHPPAPLLVAHQPSTDCTVSGFSIPAGTAVYVNAWAIHRDPKIWKDPEEFKPERFLEDGMDPLFDYKGGNEVGYMPFGAGRRACPGIMLAERMMKYTLASLLHSFDWRLPEKAEKTALCDRFGFVLKKTEALVAVPGLRLSKPELYASA